MTPLAKLYAPSFTASKPRDEDWQPYTLLAEQLIDVNGQFPIIEGETHEGHRIEIFTSATFGSWTAVVVRGDGQARIMADKPGAVSTAAPIRSLQTA
jgi:hypothetical protein